VELHLAGVTSQADIDAVAGSSFVRMHGYVSHPESVALMRSADLLFLPMHDLPEGVRATIVPGKTYEYLAARRPILAAVPDGDARDILTRAGNALLTRPADIAAMRAAVASTARAWADGAPAAEPDAATVERFTYPRLAAELSEIFDRVVESAATVSR